LSIHAVYGLAYFDRALRWEHKMLFKLIRGV